MCRLKSIDCNILKRIMQLGSSRPYYFHFWLASLLLLLSHHNTVWRMRTSSGLLDVMEQTSGEEESVHLMRSCRLCCKLPSDFDTILKWINYATCSSHNSFSLSWSSFLLTCFTVAAAAPCITTCWGRWESGLLDIAEQVLRIVVTFDDKV